jgi:hypothetical protein
MAAKMAAGRLGNQRPFKSLSGIIEGKVTKKYKKRPEMAAAPYSLLLLHYGQSNADVHHDGPAKRDGFFASEAVVMPNDRVGFRGWMGGSRLDEITGFVPSNSKLAVDIQSIGAAAGAGIMAAKGSQKPDRVIIRSEAQGGLRFMGGDGFGGIYLDEHREHAPTYHNLIQTIREIAHIAEQTKIPVKRIYLHFVHQESDRGDTRRSYLAKLHNFMADVECDIAHLGLPIVWLLSQAGGTSATGNGNAWPNRLALLDIEDRARNIHVVMARYAYPLCDGIHMATDAKILVGELLGHAITALENNEEFYAPRIKAAKRGDRKITVEFDSQSPLVIDTSQHPKALPTYGFSVVPNHTASISSVEQTGPRKFCVHFEDDLPAQPVFLRYAYLNNVTKSKDSISCIGGGALREVWEKPSLGLPGQKLYKWALGFEVQC